jgi:chlorobactene glucosyltransferase
MLYQFIILAGLLIFLVNLLLNLKYLRRPSKDAQIPQPAPLISVLIPARNEEKNIRRCLESLKKQDYPNFEVLVLDDNSEDNTCSVVHEFACRDKRIKLYKGQSLPEDWAGKSYACYQLAQKAKGEWLLFADADTEHAPHMLRSILALAMEEKTSLISGFDRQISDTFPLKIVMPVMYFIMLGWAPLWWLHRSKTPRPSVAIGQFLFFSREGYWRFGGHQAVKSRVLEDIWLGVEAARSGGRHIAVDLGSVVNCYSYHTFSGVWNGLSKSIYGVVAMAPVGLAALVALATFFYVLPFFYLWRALIGGHTFGWELVVCLQVAVTLFMRWLVDSRFHEAAYSMWFQLLGMIFYVSVVIYSGWRWLTGAPVTWKDRTYDKESAVGGSVSHHS